MGELSKEKFDKIVREFTGGQHSLNQNRRDEIKLGASGHFHEGAGRNTMSEKEAEKYMEDLGKDSHLSPDQLQRVKDRLGKEYNREF